MDYQNGVVDMLDEPDELLSRAEEAIATARRAGAHVGYVRVAFEDADLAAIPPTSRMGARVSASADAFRDDSPNAVPVQGFLHRSPDSKGDWLVLTHGAGSNCKASLLVALADSFCASGWTVLRCDLPFRQKRPHGPPPHDYVRLV